MKIIFRPFVAWPGKPTSHRRASQFSSTYPATLQLLDRELELLGAREAVLQLDITEAEIRTDGLPRATARPAHPGVVLAFESLHGPLQYATDVFDDWQDNLRAIALGLESLRRVDRYGITKRGEQYRGWRALPPGNGQVYVKRGAAKFILDLAGVVADEPNIAGILAGESFYRTTYRLAAAKAHPDQGGSPDAFAALQDAKRLLDGPSAQ